MIMDTISFASPSPKHMALPSIHTLGLPVSAFMESPDSGYSSTSDEDMLWKPSTTSLHPGFNQRARQMSASSIDSRLSTTPPPMRQIARYTTNDSPRTPSPPALTMPAISRHRHFKTPKTAQEMTPVGERAFTVSLPTPAQASGAPSHLRLVPARSLDEADAAVYVQPGPTPSEPRRSLLLVGPENLRRAKIAERSLTRGARVHPYRIVRLVTPPVTSL